MHFGLNDLNKLKIRCLRMHHNYTRQLMQSGCLEHTYNDVKMGRQLTSIWNRAIKSSCYPPVDIIFICKTLLTIYLIIYSVLLLYKIPSFVLYAQT